MMITIKISQFFERMFWWLTGVQVVCFFIFVLFGEYIVLPPVSFPAGLTFFTLPMICFALSMQKWYTILIGLWSLTALLLCFIGIVPDTAGGGLIIAPLCVLAMIIPRIYQGTMKPKRKKRQHSSS